MQQSGGQKSLQASGAATRLESLIAQLAAGQPWHRPMGAAPQPETLLRYLCGALSAAEMREVEQALLRQPAVRADLRAIYACWSALQTLACSEIEARALLPDLAGQTARAWHRVLQERIALASEGRRPWGATSWNALRAHIAEGGAESQTAWQMFLGFADRMKRELYRPRVAVARSLETAVPEITGDLPAGIQVSSFRAELLPGGDLIAELTLDDGTERGLLPPAPTAAWLLLTAPGETWPLVETRLIGGRAHWVAPAFAEALQLPSDALWAQIFCIHIGSREFIIDRRPYYQVPAEIYADSGPTDREESLNLTAPQWHDQHLRFEVAVPAAVRSRLADYSLYLELRITTLDKQHLGAWPLQEWDDSPRCLEIYCPGAPDSGSFPIALLQFSLRRPEAASTEAEHSARLPPARKRHEQSTDTPLQ